MVIISMVNPLFLSNTGKTNYNYEILLGSMECPSLAILSRVIKKDKYKLRCLEI